MRKTLIAIAIIAGAFLPAQGQSLITLNPGESLTYSFTTAPRTAQLLRNPGDQLGGVVLIGDWDKKWGEGDQLHYELFENASLTLSLASGTLTASDFTAGGDARTAFVPGAWQDLEGSLRLTMLSGTQDFLAGVQIYKDSWAAPGVSIDLYSFPLAVPEPSSCALCLLGLACAAIMRRHNKSVSHG